VFGESRPQPAAGAGMRASAPHLTTRPPRGIMESMPRTLAQKRVNRSFRLTAQAADWIDSTAAAQGLSTAAVVELAIRWAMDRPAFEERLTALETWRREREQREERGG